MYKKYIAHSDQEELESVSKAIKEPPAKKSLFSNLGSRLLKKESSIEVFDVLVRSKLRLQMFDLDFGKDIQLIPSKSDYLSRMEDQMRQDEKDQDSVYLDLQSIDKSLWDLENPDFE